MRIPSFLLAIFLAFFSVNSFAVYEDKTVVRYLECRNSSSNVTDWYYAPQNSTLNLPVKYSSVIHTQYESPTYDSTVRIYSNFLQANCTPGACINIIKTSPLYSTANKASIISEFFTTTPYVGLRYRCGSTPKVAPVLTIPIAYRFIHL